MKPFLFISSLLFFVFSGIAQQNKPLPKNWHLLDKDSTGYYGISLSKAYDFLKVKKLKSKKVLVAVIDSGVDTAHEDLKTILWTNQKEIAGNGIDDDKNGYVDDIHGWNFIGGRDGRNVKENTSEDIRLYHKLKAKYGSLIPDETSVSAQEKEDIELYKKIQQKLLSGIDANDIYFFKKILPPFKKGDEVIKKDLAKDEYNCSELENYVAVDVYAEKTKDILTQFCMLNKTKEITNKDIINQLEKDIKKADAMDTPPADHRKEIVQDDENNINDRFYGNNDIMAATAEHGTHCSGIIGAIRNNGKGMDGVADNVSIMMIRAVPDGDEYDKDVANSIRYAVDNGAQIISMSFGKDFSPQKQWVDDAVKYAQKKGVLLVHAAGNDAKNTDSTDNFPKPLYADGKTRADNWIEVGASGDPADGGLTASFSNYGKNAVDIFAPGVNIYSSVPGGNKYAGFSGTSMACPVVAGIAALLLEYFPRLSASQLKYVIEKSAVAPDIDVDIPGTDRLVKLSDISKTGGLVNAYQAVKLASMLKPAKKITKDVLPRPKLTRKKKG